MNRELIITAAIAMLLAVAAAAYGADYQIDVAHTTVGFSIRHMVINDVKGVFKKFEGALKYDPENPEAFEISGAIRVDSIDTGIEDRDRHLINEDFFDAAQFPEISFKSEEVVKEGSVLQVTGPFTMHGVTKNCKNCELSHN